MKLSIFSVIKKETENTKIVMIDNEMFIVPIWTKYIARDHWKNQFLYAYENEPNICYNEAKFIKNGGKRRKISIDNLLDGDFFDQCIRV